MTYPCLLHFQQSSCRLGRGFLACILLAASCSLTGCHLVEFSFEDAGGMIGRETYKSFDYTAFYGKGATTEERGMGLIVPFLDRDSEDRTSLLEFPDRFLLPSYRQKGHRERVSF